MVDRTTIGGRRLFLSHQSPQLVVLRLCTLDGFPGSEFHQSLLQSGERSSPPPCGRSFACSLGSLIWRQPCTILRVMVLWCGSIVPWSLLSIPSWRVRAEYITYPWFFLVYVLLRRMIKLVPQQKHFCGSPLVLPGIFLDAPEFPFNSSSCPWLLEKGMFLFVRIQLLLLSILCLEVHTWSWERVTNTRADKVSIERLKPVFSTDAIVPKVPPTRGRPWRAPSDFSSPWAAPPWVRFSSPISPPRPLPSSPPVLRSSHFLKKKPT